jgi:hypothetical protein
MVFISKHINCTCIVGNNLSSELQHANLFFRVQLKSKLKLKITIHKCLLGGKSINMWNFKFHLILQHQKML